MRAVEDGGGCFPTGRHYPGIAHLLRIVARGLADEVDAAVAMLDVPLVAIDTETTGKDPAVDRIVEIACVIWEAGQITARHRWLVNPERTIPQESVDVHGIRDDDVRDKPPFRTVCREILAVLEGRIPLAYNAEFDRMFLNEELIRAGIAGKKPPPAARRGIEWIDPLVWARQLQKDEKGKSLSEVAERLGVALERAHSAIADAEAALHVHASFSTDVRVPKSYGAFVQEQRRLARLFDEDRQYWRK